ncbi:beta-carotene 15,15'-monooxygenase [Halobacteriales archaeon SW_7_71_33]|nr:MAG: beta-carotene 15,15'-monooxygenase [Halobacteriales archaeon SW_7_71_33]
MAVDDESRDRQSSVDERLGFHSVREELDTALAVEGSLPPWLDGRFVRNGPGLFEAGGRSIDHWFDGPALLRAFGFEPSGAGAGDSEDRVRYVDRFLRTDAYEAAREGRVAAAGFAEGDDRGLLDRLRSLVEPTDNANADVARLSGAHVALTESPRAVRFDPATLETLGELDWRDDLPAGHTTPHLKPEPEPGGDGRVGYLTTFLPRAAYRLFRVPADEPRREEFARVPVDEPAYMHSLAVADRFAVLVEPPFTIPPHRVLTGDGPLLDRYEWHPQRGTRFVVVDRRTGTIVCESRTAPFLPFHHANAFRDGDELVLDTVAFDSPSVLNAMYVEEMRARPRDGDGGAGELRRYRVPLSGATPRAKTLATDVAMPAINERRTGRRHRHVYAQRAADGPATEVVRLDVETGAVRAWDADAYVSEPMFVPRPDADAENDRDGDGEPPSTPDGVVLVELLDPDRERSAIAVLDAAGMTERARAWAPHALPFGFHGAYLDGA